MTKPGTAPSSASTEGTEWTLPEHTPTEMGAPGRSVVHPVTVGDLRASLAACVLIVATVVRTEHLETEPTRLLRLVVDQLASDIDFLWDHEPAIGAGTDSTVEATQDFGEVIRRVFACGNLLNSASTWFNLEPDLALRLSAAVAELDETVQLVWTTSTATVDLLDG